MGQNEKVREHQDFTIHSISQSLTMFTKIKFINMQSAALTCWIRDTLSLRRRRMVMWVALTVHLFITLILFFRCTEQVNQNSLVCSQLLQIVHKDGETHLKLFKRRTLHLQKQDSLWHKNTNYCQAKRAGCDSLVLQAPEVLTGLFSCFHALSLVVPCLCVAIMFITVTGVLICLCCWSVAAGMFGCMFLECWCDSAGAVCKWMLWLCHVFVLVWILY